MNKEIIENIKQIYKERFNSDPILVAAPGRINLIGEHVDYNQGIVFPAAINKYIYAAFSKSTENQSKLYALDLDESFELDLNNLYKIERSHWANYAIGIVSGLKKRSKQISNFNLIFSGDIPLGAGLSSSAALENSIVFGLNELFKLELNREEMIQISLEAEHKFAGVECGIMDQFSSMMGQKDHALLLNCKDFSSQLIPLNLTDYQLILINTKVKHILSDSPYNERKNQCKEGLQILQSIHPELSSLAETSLIQLEECRSRMPNIVYNRSLFIIEEVQRVREAKNALENKDWKKFGQLLYASHQGLQHLYEVSCSELNFLVDLTKQEKAVLGSRMMGGGFGGCTLNLVKKTDVPDFIENTAKKYYSKFSINIESYPVKTSNGAQLID